MMKTRRPATHCNTLQHTATHCNTLQHIETATHCNTLQHTATHCNTLQHTATHCNTLLHTAAHCSTLKHTAAHCSTLQHTANYYITLQHLALPCNRLSLLEPKVVPKILQGIWSCHMARPKRSWVQVWSNCFDSVSYRFTKPVFWCCIRENGIQDSPCSVQAEHKARFDCFNRTSFCI